MIVWSFVKLQFWTWTRLQIGGRVSASTIFSWWTAPDFLDFAIVFSIYRKWRQHHCRAEAYGANALLCECDPLSSGMDCLGHFCTEDASRTNRYPQDRTTSSETMTVTASVAVAVAHIFSLSNTFHP